MDEAGRRVIHLDGAAGLRFMGVLDPEHNYRPKILAVPSRWRSEMTSPWPRFLN